MNNKAKTITVLRAIDSLKHYEEVLESMQSMGLIEYYSEKAFAQNIKEHRKFLDESLEKLLRTSPGRSDSGNLRNFKAMNKTKLRDVIYDIEKYGYDIEALKVAKTAYNNM